MKLLFAFLLAFSASAQTDKALHYWAGAAISGGTSLLIYETSNKRDKVELSCALGALAGITAGFSKEYVYDGLMHRGVVDPWDAMTTYWGAVGGTIISRVIIDKRHKKNLDDMIRFEHQKKLVEDLNKRDSDSTVFIIEKPIMD